MDTKKLRQKILDLAIRGKLVPQDPNDEPASVLLERIQAEKERLIKEGKIKRSKKSASDTPRYENVPFEVPESWEWLNVESFTYDLQYGTSEKSSNEGDVPVLRMGNISRIGTIDFTDLVYSSNKDDISKYALLKDDILFNRTNSSEWVGKTAIFKSDLPAIYAGYLIRVRCILVCPDYINFVLNSSYHRDWCNSVKTDAVNQSNINAQKLSKHLIPIPPYEEQLRIVAETKIWMNVIDKLDCDVSEFEQLISKIKSKILDLAIHGKLVPQDPNDEPAIELLKRINPKHTPCDNAHYPFDVPLNWVWAKGLDIFKPMKATLPLGDTFKYIDIDAIDNKKNVITSVKIINTKQAPSRASRYTEKGCVLFSMVRPYLRNIAMVTEDDCIASTGFFVCLGKGCLLPKFCYFLMLSNYVVDGLNDFMKGDNSPSITKAQIEEYIFPLPPLNEQKRIVAKIEELFAVLDEIQKSIEV